MSRKDAAMKKVTVSEGFYLYTFTDYNDKHTNSITILVRDLHNLHNLHNQPGQDKGQGKRALIIDPSYPEFMEKVKIDLQSQGIEPEIIVLSHYHPDHVSGCAILPQCSIYVDEHYENNFQNCHIWEPGYTYLRASHLIHGGDSLSFGDFKLRFHSAPGHSRCSIITEITNKIFHIGDLIMICVNRKNSIPYIADGGSFKEHIKSLELIKKMDPDAIVVPHGGFIDNKKRILDLVDDRIFYLEHVLNSQGELPIEKCLKNDVSWYENLEFHDTNLIQLF